MTRSTRTWGALFRATSPVAGVDGQTSGSAPPPVRLDRASVLAEMSRQLWASLELRPSVDGIDADIDRHLADHFKAANGYLDQADVAFVHRSLRQDLLGLGPIEPFFDDPAISEIMVNGTGRIYVERNGVMEDSGLAYSSEDRLRLAIARIVAPAGRRVDQSSPLCDVRLPDGSRANVVLPPVSVGGPLLTIRRFRPAFGCMEDLISVGALSSDQAERLRHHVEERKNILVAGNSGAGKTTLLNAMAGFIPDDERIITMEDAAELRLKKPHVVRLETRPPNAEGFGEVSMRDLVINALRMRPDRLVVGECRGREAVPMLQAMNTGHDGSMTTVHANSAADALERLEAMALMGAEWPADVVRHQIRSAIHIIVHVRRSGTRRRLEEILDVSRDVRC